MSHLPEFGDDDLQSRIDAIRQQNRPREWIPAKRKPLPAGAGVWVGDAPEDEPPDLPASVADLYRVLSEQLMPTQQTLLKAFWLLMAEDSRMLDWMEKETKDYYGYGNVDEMIHTVSHGKPLREAIKELMSHA